MTSKKQGIFLNYLPPLVMIAIGVGHYVRHGVDLVTIIPIVLGTFALYLAVFNRPLLQRLLTFLMKLWYPISQFIAVFLFVVAFYVIFAPVGLLLKLFRKDILNRNFKSNCLSYWIDRSIKEQSSYTQQF